MVLLSTRGGAFRDALALRYGWCPKGMATTCVCGKANKVDHATSCSRGGIIISRHNEMHDLTATLLSEVTKCVECEPVLQPLSGEVLNGRSSNIQDESRLDIKCKGIWNNAQDTFFDVRVFNPLALSNKSLPLQSLFKRNEMEKRRTYEQRVREIEHASFTPLIFSATGGMGPMATILY